MLVADPVSREAVGQRVAIEVLVVRERGMAWTLMRSCTAASPSKSEKSETLRVECPIVKNGFGELPRFSSPATST